MKDSAQLIFSCLTYKQRILPGNREDRFKLLMRKFN